MAQRSDSPLIKHLAQTYGPETAKDWQRPPLVLLPGGEFMGHLLTDYDDVQVEPAPPFPRMPWRDVILDYPSGPAAAAAHMQTALNDPSGLSHALERMRAAGGCDERVLVALEETIAKGGFDATYGPRPTPSISRLWVRLRLLDHAVTAPWMSEVLTLGDREQETVLIRDRLRKYQLRGHYLIAELWEHYSDEGRAFLPHPHTVIFDTRTAAMLDSLPCVTLGCSCDWMNLERNVISGYLVLFVSLIKGAMFYLAQCNEYLTEVAPTPKPLPKNQQKVHQAKPWLNESLPHYILLDPTRVAEYGHPSGIQAPVGHHASPHPHTRRGHWAALKHEKFARNEDGSIKRVWRKQAWVGATEWTDDLDQRYRVLLPQ